MIQPALLRCPPLERENRAAAFTSAGAERRPPEWRKSAARNPCFRAAGWAETVRRMSNAGSLPRVVGPTYPGTGHIDK
jgi:hypothetical protein